MTAFEFMLFIVLFLIITMGGLLAVSELIMWLEDKAYKNAEEGGDWMDI